jgi:hypothetical protein
MILIKNAIDDETNQSRNKQGLLLDAIMSITNSFGLYETLWQLVEIADNAVDLREKHIELKRSDEQKPLFSSVISEVASGQSR